MHSLSYYLTMLLPETHKGNLVKNIVKKKYSNYTINFPHDITQAKNILIIIPSSKVEIIHQVQNIYSLIDFFNTPRIFILCEESSKSYIQILPKVEKVFVYSHSESNLFSRQIKQLRDEMSKEFIDICIMLERKPSLSLLLFANQLGSRIKISYENPDLHIFFNVHVRDSLTNPYRTASNNCLSKAIGIPTLSEKKWWQPTQEVIDQTKTVFKEHSLHVRSPLIGIDIFYLYSSVDPAWTIDLLQKLHASNNNQLVLFFEPYADKTFSQWLKTTTIPLFPVHGPLHLAAFLQQIDVCITGKSPAFVISEQLQLKTIGIFSEKDAPLYFKKTPYSVLLSYQNKPNSQTISDCLTELS